MCSRRTRIQPGFTCYITWSVAASIAACLLTIGIASSSNSSAPYYCGWGVGPATTSHPDGEPWEWHSTLASECNPSDRGNHGCTSTDCPDLAACEQKCNECAICSGFNFAVYPAPSGHGGHKCWMVKKGVCSHSPRCSPLANATVQTLKTQPVHGTGWAAWVNDRSQGCEECNAGYTRSNGGTCQACAVGSFKPSVGDSACIDCPAPLTSPPGSSALGDCSCKPGYSEGKNSTCETCVAGKYKESVSNASCISCVAGKFSLQSGANTSEACIACIAGRYSLQSGANSSHSCIACGSGKL